VITVLLVITALLIGPLTIFSHLWFANHLVLFHAILSALRGAYSAVFVHDVFASNRAWFAVFSCFETAFSGLVCAALAHGSRERALCITFVVGQTSENLLFFSKVFARQV
jgi:hypothetical protein